VCFYIWDDTTLVHCNGLGMLRLKSFLVKQRGGESDLVAYAKQTSIQLRYNYLIWLERHPFLHKGGGT